MIVIVIILNSVIMFFINFIYKKIRKKDINKIIYYIMLFINAIILVYIIIAFKTPEELIEFYFPEQKIIETYNYKNKAIVITDQELKVLWKFNNKWRQDLIVFTKINLSFVYNNECSFASYKYDKHDTIIRVLCHDDPRTNKQKKYLVTDMNNNPLKELKSVGNYYYGLIKDENYFKINGEKIKINN